MVLSLLSWLAPWLLSGLTAPITCGACFSDFTVALTAFAFAPASRVPWSASMTTGLVPFASLGRLSLSRFWASVDPVPGRVRLLLVCFPTAFANATKATSSASHATATRRRRRMQNRPRLYRAPLTDGLPGGRYGLRAVQFADSNSPGAAASEAPVGILRPEPVGNQATDLLPGVLLQEVGRVVDRSGRVGADQLRERLAHLEREHGVGVGPQHERRPAVATKGLERALARRRALQLRRGRKDQREGSRAGLRLRGGKRGVVGGR